MSSSIHIITPNKVHIIFSHIADYIHKYNIPLSYCSDEHVLVEAVHSIYAKTVKNSNYKRRFPHLLESGSVLEGGVKHFNAYNPNFSKITEV